MASSRRLEKLNNLLREEIARIIDRELEFTPGVLVTITRVSISPDLYYANVFITILGGSSQSSQKEVLEILRKNVYNIQQILNKRLKMRPVPRVNFAPDEAEESREAVEKSLAELKNKGEL